MSENLKERSRLSQAARPESALPLRSVSSRKLFADGGIAQV